MDSKKFSLVKFFIDANMPMKALESVHLREMVDSRLAKFSFRERILPDIIQHLESVIATKLQSAHSIHIITDIWTSNTMADFEAAGAVLTYENLRRELIVIGMERMWGPHTAENIKDALQTLINKYEFDKPKIRSVVSDEGKKIFCAYSRSPQTLVNFFFVFENFE